MKLARDWLALPFAVGVVTIALAVGIALELFVRQTPQSAVPGAIPSEVARMPGGALAGIPAPPAPKAKLDAVTRTSKSETQAASGAPEPGANRQLVRTGSIDLLVPDVERALAALGLLAVRQGGSIDGLEDRRPASRGERHVADLKLSVPSSRFEGTLKALEDGGIGRLRSRSVKAEDVGDRIVDSRARLRNLRRTETDMLRIMDRSGKISEVLAVENELASVREQIEQLAAQVAALQSSVAFSTVAIHLEDELVVPTVDRGTRTQLAAAWSDALAGAGSFGVALLGRLFVAVAFAPYAVVLLAAIQLGAAIRRRRRRGTAV